MRFRIMKFVLPLLAGCAAGSTLAMTTLDHASKTQASNATPASEAGKPASGATAGKGKEERTKEAAQPAMAQPAKPKK